jgi:CDP-4-dehydro-6-deoxyglucose reductase, E1
MFWNLQENVLSQEDLDILVCFIQETSRFTQFKKVREFEEQYAQWQGCKYCVFVNSGSSANLLLVNALKEIHGWRDGDEVIVPAVTWSTNISPILHNGLKPVFVDVNLHDFSFDYEYIEECISKRTRAIFITHLIGFPSNISQIKETIGKRNILIMEDCCESQGATINGIKVGNFGIGSTFSFYWGHHMTSVEGGMICTNNEELYKMLVLKRSHGLARELPERYHADLRKRYKDIDFQFLFLTDGFNVRNTELHAVLGLMQLKKLDLFIKIRNRNYARFAGICKQYKDALIIPESDGMSSFVLPFLFKDIHQKQNFQKAIADAGIESRPLVAGNILRQPFLKKYYNPEKFANADFLHTNAFYIGNNQFVDDKRLNVLEELMAGFFACGRSEPTT